MTQQEAKAAPESEVITFEHFCVYDKKTGEPLSLGGGMSNQIDEFPNDPKKRLAYFPKGEPIPSLDSIWVVDGVIVPREDPPPPSPQVMALVDPEIVKLRVILEALEARVAVLERGRRPRVEHDHV